MRSSRRVRASTSAARRPRSDRSVPTRSSRCSSGARRPAVAVSVLLLVRASADGAGPKPETASTSRRSGVAACTRGRKTAPSGLLCVIAACWKASMAEGCCACGRAASSRPCAVDDGGRVRVRPVGQRRVGGGASYVVGECRRGILRLGAWAVMSRSSGSGHLVPVRSGTVVRTRRRRRYPVGVCGAHQSGDPLTVHAPARLLGGAVEVGDRSWASPWPGHPCAGTRYRLGQRRVSGCSPLTGRCVGSPGAGGTSKPARPARGRLTSQASRWSSTNRSTGSAGPSPPATHARPAAGGSHRLPGPGLTSPGPKPGIGSLQTGDRLRGRFLRATRLGRAGGAGAQRAGPPCRRPRSCARSPTGLATGAACRARLPGPGRSHAPSPPGNRLVQAHRPTLQAPRNSSSQPCPDHPALPNPEDRNQCTQTTGTKLIVTVRVSSHPHQHTRPARCADWGGWLGG